MESKLKLPLSGVLYDKNGGYISIQQLVRSNVTFFLDGSGGCLLYTSPSPRDGLLSRMPSSA